jgi:hypothetical protein
MVSYQEATLETATDLDSVSPLTGMEVSESKIGAG